MPRNFVSIVKYHLKYITNKKYLKIYALFALIIKKIYSKTKKLNYLTTGNIFKFETIYSNLYYFILFL